MSCWKNLQQKDCLSKHLARESVGSCCTLCQVEHHVKHTNNLLVRSGAKRQYLQLVATDNPTIVGSIGVMSTAQSMCEYKELTCVHLFLRACLASSAWQIDDLVMHTP